MYLITFKTVIFGNELNKESPVVEGVPESTVVEWLKGKGTSIKRLGESKVKKKVEVDEDGDGDGDGDGHGDEEQEKG